MKSMKSMRKLLVAVGVSVVLIAGAAAVSASTGSNRDVTRDATADATVQEALQHMVEEEKLAHDVYVTLADGTDLQMFDRIGTSEMRHEAEVQSLLTRYGLSDPMAGNGIGEFTDPAFATLYDQLVAQGSLSDTAALQVGVTIEQLDIADLESRLGSSLPNDVADTFARLVAGSERHLAAFSR